ncbi:MAG TPA: class I SAM-dependent methyltransferase, partial [Bacillota bacterium]|nr:class I SAM-dependent methyltransferase [Bacillota bacterium]
MNTVDTYREFAQFYDLYTTNFKIDLPLYLHYCNEHHNILEVGCGTGRVLNSLAEAGCKVFGVDISDAMLAIAGRKLQEQIGKGTIRLKNFDFSNGPLEEEFDRVLITFYTLNYLIDVDQCQRFIQNIKKSLSNNGLILIDLFYPRSFQNPESNGVWFEKD